MTLWVLGAHNKTNLQRRSIRWLTMDETWRAPTGHMAAAEARVTAFGWLGKCLFMSQGGEEDDDTHRKHETTEKSRTEYNKRWRHANPEKVKAQRERRDENGMPMRRFACFTGIDGKRILECVAAPKPLIINTKRIFQINAFRIFKIITCAYPDLSVSR